MSEYCACHIALAIQFPRMYRFYSRCRHGVGDGTDSCVARAIVAPVNEASEALLEKRNRSIAIAPDLDASEGEGVSQPLLGPNKNNSLSAVLRGTLTSQVSLVNHIRAEVESAAHRVSDISSWPRHSPCRTIPQRLLSAFGRPNIQDDSSRRIRAGALRFALAFSIGTLPTVFIEENVSAYWVPMTVAFIMGPTQAATNKRVASRTTGTLMGICLGVAISPLFGTSDATLAALLGLTTFACILLFKVNYALFTFFMTSWVFTIVVGPNNGDLGLVTLRRT